MLSSLFPFLYCLTVLVLLWQAFRVMGRGLFPDDGLSHLDMKKKNLKGDRTGRLTIHPELLDQEGRITDEELLTVRFSGDTDSPHSAQTSAK